MGLDWNPLARPRAGSEEEFERLLRELTGPGDADREVLIERFHAISETPYETLEAPRVGFDSSADRWLSVRLEQTGSDLSMPEALEQMRGYFVLDLVDPHPGLPMYGSEGYAGVDRYTFRGEFLRDVEDVLGEELFEKAWSTMTASELQDYGRDLLATARQFAARHDLEHLEYQREPPKCDDELSAESRAHILFSAAHWCCWWSERGHGMEAYY